MIRQHLPEGWYHQFITPIVNYELHVDVRLSRARVRECMIRFADFLTRYPPMLLMAEHDFAHNRLSFVKRIAK